MFIFISPHNQIGVFGRAPSAGVEAHGAVVVTVEGVDGVVILCMTVAPHTGGRSRCHTSMAGNLMVFCAF